jgi:hypothetical protein
MVDFFLRNVANKRSNFCCKIFGKIFIDIFDELSDMRICNLGIIFLLKYF